MERSQVRGSSIVFALILLLTASGSGRAQKKLTQPNPQFPAKHTQQADPTKDFRESFIKASEDYKANLQTMLVLYENDVKKLSEQSAKWKELYADGLISRLEYEKSTNDISAAQIKVDEVRKQIAAAEITIAEARRQPQADELRNAEMAAFSRTARAWTTGNTKT